MHNPWVRRPITIALYTLALLAALALFPALLAAAAGSDLVRRSRWGATRALLFACFYLVMQQAGILASAALWALHGGPWHDPKAPRYIQRHFRLQQWWSGSLFALAIKLWRIDIQIEGEAESDPAQGPLLVFIRHAGMIDVLLPSLVIANRFNLLLRYVLDAQLLWDPCLDLVGHRLGNAFVRRSSGDPEAQIARIVSEINNLGAHEGALLYPEGARFTARRKARLLERLAERGERRLLEHARALQHVMPPKLGGALGLLRSNPQADVLFFAHAGLDRLQSFARVLDGTAVGTVIRVKLWRVPRAAIPAEEDAQIAWLFTQWEEMDAAVGALLTSLPSA